ncbi:MAG TPA: response regulator [Actinomycetota bacterium]|nr:response regulator [Actinomycetota bacterium]
MRTVLIVEDDPDIALMMSVTLRLAGNEVAIAPSGEDALARLRRQAPSVLILDLGLPGIGGREVLRQVRSDHALHRLPVVVVSAHAGSPTIQDISALGCDRYLTKPFDPKELVKAVAALPAA